MHRFDGVVVCGTRVQCARPESSRSVSLRLFRNEAWPQLRQAGCQKSCEDPLSSYPGRVKSLKGRPSNQPGHKKSFKGRQSCQPNSQKSFRGRRSSQLEREMGPEAHGFSSKIVPRGISKRERTHMKPATALEIAFYRFSNASRRAGCLIFLRMASVSCMSQQFRQHSSAWPKSSEKIAKRATDACQIAQLGAPSRSARRQNASRQLTRAIRAARSRQSSQIE